MLIVGFFQFWGGFTGASFTDPSKAKSSLPTVLWFYDLSLMLVLPCHKTIKNSLILAHGAAALVTSLRLPCSHSDWGVEKHNPCWTFIMRGVNWRIKPPSSSSFFSCFPVSRPFLPFSWPLSWDPLFCFLLFVWVAWKLWQLSSWEGFFFSFYECDWGGWKVMRSAYGWYASEFLFWHIWANYYFQLFLIS